MLKFVVLAASLLWNAAAFASDFLILQWYHVVAVGKSSAPMCVVGGSGGGRSKSFLYGKHPYPGVYFTYVRNNSGRERWSAHVGLYKKHHAKSFQYLAIDGKIFTKTDGNFTPEESFDIANLLKKSSKLRYEYSATDSETGELISFSGQYWIGLFDRVVRACRTSLERR